MKAVCKDIESLEATPRKRLRLPRERLLMLMDSTHVVELDNSWEVMRMDGSLKGKRRKFPTKEAALRKAHQVSVDIPRTYMYIHDKSGTVERIRVHVPKSTGK